MDKLRFLVFGLQSSGKTTFAAALWHLLDSREVQTALSKGSHTGEFHYLEKIAQLWSEGWRLERTTMENVEDVRINLKGPNAQSEIALEFTDLAGESFEQAFANRLCEPRLVDAVQSADGLILFVSAQRKVDDVTILDAFGDVDNEEAAEGGGNQTASVGGPAAVEEAAGTVEARPPGAASNQNAKIGDGTKEAPWDPSKTPHQVQLVDLLQSFRHPPFSKAKFKVAVIISAWDLADGATPDNWFEMRFPLLNQYLGGQFGSSGFRIYGVSAQGGQLSMKGEEASPDRDRLLSLVPASKRILIDGPEVQPHDITRPIYWLSGTEPHA